MRRTSGARFIRIRRWGKASDWRQSSTRAPARIFPHRAGVDRTRLSRPSGGTGRRSGLKIHRGKTRPGSIPGTATSGASAVINLLIALAARGLRVLGFYVTRIAHALGSIFPGAVAAIGTYILLARRTGKQLEAVMGVAQKEMMARKPDRAVQALQDAFALSRWQFGISSSLHANIGVLLYVQKKYDEAEPHLRKGAATMIKLWLAQAMLGAILFRRKQYPEMEKVFDGAMRGNKGETLLYAVYAWVENQRGEKKKAIEILQKGVKENPSDEKLKTLLGRAQNDKRLKLDGWGDQWSQLWLETPPMMAGPAGRGAFSAPQRFGRARGFRW